MHLNMFWWSRFSVLRVECLSAPETRLFRKPCKQSQQRCLDYLPQVDVNLGMSCPAICRSLSNMLNQTADAVQHCTGSVDGVAAAAPAADLVGAKIDERIKQFAAASVFMKIVSNLVAAQSFLFAAKKWTNVKVSTGCVVGGWLYVFVTPLLISMIPWVPYLNLDAQYEDLAPIAMPKYAVKVALARVQIGAKLYVSTFQLALAVVPASLRALQMIKIMLPGPVSRAHAPTMIHAASCARTYSLAA